MTPSQVHRYVRGLVRHTTRCATAPGHRPPVAFVYWVLIFSYCAPLNCCARLSNIALGPHQGPAVTSNNAAAKKAAIRSDFAAHGNPRTGSAQTPSRHPKATSKRTHNAQGEYGNPVRHSVPTANYSVCTMRPRGSYPFLLGSGHVKVLHGVFLCQCWAHVAPSLCTCVLLVGMVADVCMLTTIIRARVNTTVACAVVYYGHVQQHGGGGLLSADCCLTMHCGALFVGVFLLDAA